MAFSAGVRMMDLEEKEIVAICAGVGAFGGVLSYLHKVVEGRPFRMAEFALYTTTSIFCGLLTGGFFSYAELPTEVVFSACGFAGWMGTGLLKLGETVIRKRLDVTDEELKDDDNSK